MQYLKPNVCKQLEANGLVSEGETFWYRKKKNPGAWFLAEYTPVYSRTHENVQAFTISDILLNADNARKLWGEEKITWCYPQFRDISKRHWGWYRKSELKPHEIEQKDRQAIPGSYPIDPVLAMQIAYDGYFPSREMWEHQCIELLKKVHHNEDIEPELQKAIESKPL